jgi:hypothetical protein
MTNLRWFKSSKRPAGSSKRLNRARVEVRVNKKPQRSEARQWIGRRRDSPQEGIFLSKLRRPHGSEEQSFRALAQMQRLKERKGRY